MILGLLSAGGLLAARRLLLGCLGVICCATQAAAEDAPAKPRRIVSLNMCTNEFVLHLADRDLRA